jgi:uncharacterized protein YjbJ (UPF0337 family)
MVKILSSAGLTMLGRSCPINLAWGVTEWVCRENAAHARAGPNCLNRTDIDGRRTPHWVYANYRLLSVAILKITHPNKTKTMKSSTYDKAQGTEKIIAGTAKEVAGKLLGNHRLQAGGKTEKIEGQVQKKIGNIKKAHGN